MEGNEKFAREHGNLTYRELTMKDRHRGCKGPFPQIVEEINVGPFRRIYQFNPPDSWKVIQHNNKPIDDIVQPVGCNIHPVITDSSYGIYDGRYFGISMEDRKGATKDGKRRMDFGDLEACYRKNSHRNFIWFDEDLGENLYSTPILRNTEDYTVLMGLHIGVLSGENKWLGVANNILLEDRARRIELSLAHLSGFLDAAKTEKDELTERCVNELIKYTQRCIQ